MPERDANQLTEPCGACGKSPAWHQGWTDDGSPPVRDANQLAADATEAIDNLSRIVGEHRVGPSGGTTGGWYAITVLKAALVELVGLVGTLQQERDSERRWCKHWAKRAEAAEAALAEKDAALTNMTGWHNEAQARVNELEAALATTRQALTQIEELSSRPVVTHIARRALAETQEKP
jgi:hypothetical protein